MPEADLPERMNFLHFMPVTWKRLPTRARVVFALFFIVYLSGAFVLIFAITGLLGDRVPSTAAWPAAFVAAIGLLVSAFMMALADRLNDERKFRVAEERSREHPEKSRYAWDLARLKLESYLDRNLTHASMIFYLTAFVMTCGMALIGMGIWRSLTGASEIAPAALAALAGIVIQLVGGTLLLIYRSTATQTQQFVLVLERINAVGMSINILETIDETSAEVRNAARADIAKDLLSLYGPRSSAKGRKAGRKRGQAGN